MSANRDGDFHQKWLAARDLLETEMPKLQATLSVVEGHWKESKADADQLREWMAMVLELCLAGAFAFWATLSCLAGWERMQPRHSGH